MPHVQTSLPFDAPPAPAVRSSPAHAPARVLLMTGDRRYRAVAATLLSQRGYAVTSSAAGEDLAAVVVRERPDVAVLDATPSLTRAAWEAARLQSLRPRVTVVAVSADTAAQLSALPVLPKWGDFTDLFAAIDRAGTRPRAEVDRVL